MFNRFNRYRSDLTRGFPGELPLPFASATLTNVARKVADTGRSAVDSLRDTIQQRAEESFFEATARESFTSPEALRESLERKARAMIEKAVASAFPNAARAAARNLREVVEEEKKHDEEPPEKKKKEPTAAQKLRKKRRRQAQRKRKREKKKAARNLREVVEEEKKAEEKTEEKTEEKEELEGADENSIRRFVRLVKPMVTSSTRDGDDDSLQLTYAIVYRDDEGEIRYKKNGEIDQQNGLVKGFDVAGKNTRSIVADLKKWAKFELSSPTNYIRNIRPVSVRYSKKPEDVDLAQSEMKSVVRGYRPNVPCVDSFHESGECVIDWLMGEGREFHGFTKYKNREELKKMLRSGTRVRKAIDFGDEGFGVTPVEVAALCEKQKVSHVCIDPQGWPVSVNLLSGGARNSKKKPFYYTTNGQHIFPIVEKRARASLAARFRELNKKASDRRTVKTARKKPDEEVKIDGVFKTVAEARAANATGNVYLTADYLNEEIVRSMVESKILYSHRDYTYTGDFVRWKESPERTWYVNHDLEEVLALCEKFKTRFENQNLGKLCETLFRKEWRTSHLVGRLFRLFTSMNRGGWVGKLPGWLRGELRAYDMNKMYSSILDSDRLPLYNVTSEIEDVRAGMEEEGFYLVEIEGDVLDLPHGKRAWLSSPYIRELVEDGFKVGIVKKLIPTGWMSFKTFVRRVFENLDEKCAKTVVNHFVGKLAQSRRTHNDVWFADTPETSGAIFHRHAREGTKMWHSVVEGADLFRVERRREQTVVCCNVPANTWVVQRGWCEMRKLAREVRSTGGVPVGVRTDCLVVLGGEIPSNIGKERGQWKRETPSKSKKVLERLSLSQKPVDDVPEVEEVADWCEIEIDEERWREPGWSKGVAETIRDVIENDTSQLRGCMLVGRAGAGKSTIIRELSGLYEKNEVIRCAFTNVAAANIDGSTLHRLFGLSACDSVSTAKLSAFSGNVKLVILDEMSMVPPEFWGALAQAQAENGFGLVCAGDWNQLPPVCDGGKVFDCENSSALREMCGSYVARLEINKRADACPKMEALRDAILNDKEVKLPKDEGEFDEDAQYFAYMNSDRCAINRGVAKAVLKKKDRETKTIRSPNLQDSKGRRLDRFNYLPNHVLWVGARVIAAMGKRNKFHNGEQGIVTRFDDETTTVKMRLASGEEGEVTIEDKKFRNYFDAAYCITGHRGQGMTCTGRVVVVNPNFFHVDRKWRYTVLMRAQRFDDLSWREINDRPTEVNDE